jgi:hypothetical protein
MVRVGQRAVFGGSFFGYPATVRDAQFDGNVQGGLVQPGLTPGDDSGDGSRHGFCFIDDHP